jgi:hypothetical protein
MREITTSQALMDVTLESSLMGCCKRQKHPEVLNVTCRQ